MNAFEVRYKPPGSEVIENPIAPLPRTGSRYVGEPVAAIVAETETHARDAAETLIVDIDPTDAVTDARKAHDAPPLWPEGNTVFSQELGDRAAYDKVLSDAAHVVTKRIDLSSIAAVTLEPRNGFGRAYGRRADTLHQLTSPAPRSFRGRPCPWPGRQHAAHCRNSRWRLVRDAQRLLPRGLPKALGRAPP